MKDGGLFYSWRAQGTKASLSIAKKEMNSSVSNSTVLTLASNTTVLSWPARHSPQMVIGHPSKYLHTTLCLTSSVADMPCYPWATQPTILN